MYIGEEQTLAGHPMRKIRDVLATALEPPCKLGIRPFQDVLGLDKETALEVAQSLERTYLQPDHDEIFKIRPPRSETVHNWTLTGDGVRLAKARDIRISRAEAKAGVESCIEAIRKINVDDDLAYRVEVAIVFGSYLGEEDLLGDVDIGIKLVARFGESQKQAALEKSKHDVSQDPLCNWPRQEVWNVLDDLCSDVVDINDLCLVDPKESEQIFS